MCRTNRALNNGTRMIAPASGCPLRPATFSAAAPFWAVDVSEPSKKRPGVCQVPMSIFAGSWHTTSACLNADER